MLKESCDRLEGQRGAQIREPFLGGYEMIPDDRRRPRIEGGGISHVRFVVPVVVVGRMGSLVVAMGSFVVPVGVGAVLSFARTLARTVPSAQSSTLLQLPPEFRLLLLDPAHSPLTRTQNRIPPFVHRGGTHNLLMFQPMRPRIVVGVVLDGSLISVRAIALGNRLGERQTRQTTERILPSYNGVHEMLISGELILDDVVEYLQ
mmetsp:Transcript_30564/g.91325  ORF Transcript_30564/g.91325 Transcript_30564/m.91325 type:complete len:204 (+) Transcript_30564:649-1260(+)